MSSKNKKVIVTFLFVVAFSVGCMHDDKTNYNNEIMPTSTIDFKDTTSLLTHETTLLNEDRDIEYKSYTWQELDKLITERINLLDPLAREYIYWMHELNKEYTPKNLIMAVKYKNIGGAHFFNKEEIAGNGHTDWNKTTPNAIQYMREKTFIPIVSEMTGDYILLTAILQPIRDECSDYYGLMNEIRDTDDEIEFLKRLSDLGYYAVDIYVEDMLELDRKIPCNGVKLYEGVSVKLEEIYDNLNQMPDDYELQKYLNKYGRQVNLSSELKNNEWNLFLFEKRESQPAIIEMHIRTYHSKGGIGLRP